MDASPGTNHVLDVFMCAHYCSVCCIALCLWTVDYH